MTRAASERSRALQALAGAAARRGFRIASDLLGDRAEAEDAVQEALARACESHVRLRDPDALESWFYRVLTNVCLRALRRRRVVRWVRGLTGASEPAPDDGDRAARWAEVVARTSTDASHVTRAAELRHVVAALDRLPPKQRAAIVLRYGHELSIGETAQLLDVGAGTVKTHLVRGLRRLRAELQLQPEPEADHERSM